MADQSIASAGAPRNGAGGIEEVPDMEAGQRAAGNEIEVPDVEAGQQVEVEVEGNNEIEEVREPDVEAGQPTAGDHPVPRDNDYMSDLYRAIFMGGSDDPANQLITEAKYDDLLNCGPNGQNVLHVAALRSRDLTQKVLDAQVSSRRNEVGWKDLRDVADSFGCTPLHFAASVGVKGVTSLLVAGDTTGMRKKAVDRNGLCPIHIAASVGAMDAVRALLVGSNGAAALRDSNMGRTFLHVAVENKRRDVVKLVCKKPSPAFESIHNLQDNYGNTALHLAVQNRDKSSFSYLVGNRNVKLNLVNKAGYTPLDLANKIKIENSFASLQNPTEWMIRVLAHSGAYFSARRRDLDFLLAPSPSSSTTESSAPWTVSSSATESRVPSTVSSSATESGVPPSTVSSSATESSAPSTVLVASALIATVTFAAAFNMPGSYKTTQQDHPKPALGRHYGFKVFLIADILAFYCSVSATFSLAAYGTQGNVDPLVRRVYTQRALWFFHVALKSVIVAFALGVTVVIWDISLVATGIVAVAASAVVLYGNEALAHDIRLVGVMYSRFGLSWSWTLYPSTSSHLDWNTWRLRSFSATVVWNLTKLFGTYIFILLVAYIAQLKQRAGN